MDLDTRFRDLISEMKHDGRDQTLIELERIASEFLTAFWRRPDGGNCVRNVTTDHFACAAAEGPPLQRLIGRGRAAPPNAEERS